MSESAEFRQKEAPAFLTLLPFCPARGCKRGKIQAEPGVWTECGACNGSGYDAEAPRVKASPTSVAAAESIREIAATIRARLLKLLEETPQGLTDEEMQDRLNMAGNSQRPRRRELEKLGLIQPLGTRPVRSGRDARVWGLVRRPPDAAA